MIGYEYVHATNQYLKLHLRKGNNMRVQKGISFSHTHESFQNVYCDVKKIRL